MTGRSVRPTRKGPGIPSEIRKNWNTTYARTPYRDLPWFSPEPYAWVVEAAKGGWWRRGARILDIGC
ncbi:MAG TPA: hypothetical protein VEY07_05570, partial [Thermoplasmata archaeon]|nr:hypothetical protein [Thermoplasmata archaeon]